jgi:hypothetical protein
MNEMPQDLPRAEWTHGHKHQSAARTYKTSQALSQRMPIAEGVDTTKVAENTVELLAGEGVHPAGN